MQMQFKWMPVQAARPAVERRAARLEQARDGEGRTGLVEPALLWLCCERCFCFLGKHLVGVSPRIWQGFSTRVAGDAVHGCRTTGRALSPAQGGLSAATDAVLG